jgi:hypothetical protein
MQYLLNDLTQGSQPTKVLPRHSVSPVGLGVGTATREHRERCIDVVPQKESYFLPPVRRSRHREVEVGINSMPRSDKEVHTTQNRHFRARALHESGAKEVVPQIEVVLDPHVGLTQGHKGRYVQDPQRGEMVHFQTIELH